MLDYFSTWYKNKFSDPQTITLMVLLISAFLFVYFFSQLLIPVFVALSIAFLLDLPVAKLMKLGVSRTTSVAIVVAAFIGLTLMSLLGIPALAMMRTKEDEFINQQLHEASQEQLIAAMVKTPKLMERPIVTSKSKAIIGRPPENVLALFE